MLAVPRYRSVTLDTVPQARSLRSTCVDVLCVQTIDESDEEDGSHIQVATTGLTGSCARSSASAGPVPAVDVSLRASLHNIFSRNSTRKPYVNATTVSPANYTSANSKNSFSLQRSADTLAGPNGLHLFTAMADALRSKAPELLEAAGELLVKVSSGDAAASTSEEELRRQRKPYRQAHKKIAEIAQGAGVLHAMPKSRLRSRVSRCMNDWSSSAC